MRLNGPCLETHFKNVGFVQLLYDAKRRRIAIKPTTAKDEHTYKISRTRQGAARISGRAFLAHYQIEHDQTRSFPVKWMANPSALVISLKEHDARDPKAATE